METECYPFDLCEVVEEVHELLASVAGDKEVDLLLEYSARTPRRFLGDGSRIRQVVINLVGNAIKFTSSGHVLVSVRLRRRRTPNSQIRVSVCDTGIGIPPDKIGLLFEKFSQVDGFGHPQVWRHGAGPGHFQTAREPHGRVYRSREPAGRRIHFLVRAASATGYAAAYRNRFLWLISPACGS